MATAMRPQGFAGSPLPLCSSSSCQVRPPSVVLKKPLPLGDVGLSPPDRKVQPFRRKSHMPAKRTFGSPEFIEIIEQPVDGLLDDLHELDRKSTRLNSSHVAISYAVFRLRKKN